MGAVLLDRRTGRPEPPRVLLGPRGIPAAFEANQERGWSIRGLDGPDPDEILARAPDRILDLLERSRHDAGPFERRASWQSWREAIYATIADGTQVSNTSTETIMVPDFTLPAGYLYPGRILKYTVFFDNSTVITTPGTITLALRYGGVGGTALATSGAYAPDPTAASTNVSGYVEFYTVARAVGTSAASYTMGRMWLSDVDDASATTIIGNLNMHVIPASAPAAVNINTTTANALTPTVKFSVSTSGTNFQAHIALLEAIT